MSDWQNAALEKMEELATSKAKLFQSAKPFPHIHIDDFFEKNLFDELVDEFPLDSDPIWEASNQEGIQVKLRSNWVRESDLPPITREVTHLLNSGAFMKPLAKLTSIEKLISDPYYTGGGLNCVKRNGLLDIHVDGNWHHAMGVHRRLNVILYLNKNWNTEWGGALELWNQDLSSCKKAIDPIGNRLVIFETHDLTFHGHPSPLQCPDGRSRNSLILYYYTAAPRPTSQVVVEKPHRALWRKRQLKELS